MKIEDLMEELKKTFTQVNHSEEYLDDDSFEINEASIKELLGNNLADDE